MNSHVASWVLVLLTLGEIIDGSWILVRRARVPTPPVFRRHVGLTERIAPEYGHHTVLRQEDLRQHVRSA